PSADAGAPLKLRQPPVDDHKHILNRVRKIALRHAQSGEHPPHQLEMLSVDLLERHSHGVGVRPTPAASAKMREGRRPAARRAKSGLPSPRTAPLQPAAFQTLRPPRRSL